MPPAAIATGDRLAVLAPFIERAPFLRLLPAQALQSLAARFVEVHYAFGDIIVRQGDAASCYFLILTGRARVLRLGMDGSEVPLHVLHPGEGFGEIGLLNGGVRTATVRASEPVVCLRLDRDSFTALLDEHPSLRQHLRLQTENRRLHGFLRQYTRFGDVPLPALEALVKGLEERPVKAGEIIIRDGDAPGPMFIVEQGRVQVYKEVNGERHNLAFLRAGDFFGEYSLLRNARRFATVMALTDGRLLALAPQALHRVLNSFPEFRRVVEERTATYHTREDARVPLDFTQAVGGGQGYSDNDETARIVLSSAEREGLTAAPETAVAAQSDPATPPPPRRRGRRVPFVPQVDEADCGAAALAMVCRYFGRKVSLGYIRELCCTGPDGAGLNDLCRAATELGLTARAVKKAGDALDQVQAPAILHWDDGHWVVLLEVGRERVRLADPASGPRTLPRAEVSAHWSGYAALFDYTEAFAQAPEALPSWAWLWPFLRRYRPALIKVILLTLVICGLQLLIPALTQRTVDDIVSGTPHLKQINLIVLGLGATLGIALLLTTLQRRILTKAAGEIDGAILNFIMDRMLALPMTYFLRRRPADILRRLEGARGVRHFVVQHGVEGLLAVVQLVAFLSLMAYYNLTMSVVFVAVMAPLYVGLLFFAGKVLRPSFANIEEVEARFQLLQREVVSGIEAVKASGAEQGFREATVSDFRQATANQSANRFNVFAYEGTVQAVWFLSCILLLWLGAREVILGHGLSVGMFLAIYVLVFMMYFPVMTLVNAWEELQSASILLTRLNDLLDYPSEQASRPAGLRPVPSFAGAVEVRHLTFRYGGPDSPPALRDVSFALKAGQKVAIVGRGGAGKTTLVKCLAALLTPESGTLLYDGVDAAGVHHPELRRQFGVVLQENYLFTGSIVDNIAFGDPAAQQERVRWAAKVAGLDPFVANLPAGYQTVIGGGGLALPPGERQALAIARVLYRDPALVLLDEATCGMDVESERDLHERLADVLRDHTVITVTHRLTLVREADLILVLDRGQLVEQGTHADLLARRGLYHHLFTRQVE